MIIGGGLLISVVLITVALVTHIAWKTKTLYDFIHDLQIELMRTSHSHFASYQSLTDTSGQSQAIQHSQSLSHIWVALNSTQVAMGGGGESSQKYQLDEVEFTQRLIGRSVVKKTIFTPLLAQYQPQNIVLALDHKLTTGLLTDLASTLMMSAQDQSEYPPQLSLLVQNTHGGSLDPFNHQPKTVLVPFELSLIHRRNIKRTLFISWSSRSLTFSVPRTRSRYVKGVKKVKVSRRALMNKPMMIRDQIKDLLMSYRSLQRMTLAPRRLTPMNEILKVIELCDAYPITIIPPPLKVR